MANLERRFWLFGPRRGTADLLPRGLPPRPASIEYNIRQDHPMKSLRFAGYLALISLFVLTLCLARPALADDRGEGALDPSQPQGITVDEIIQKFAAKEKQ